jgi:glycosyltransferase involved in cell wall biosynthesis
MSMLSHSRTLLRSNSQPTRLIICHRALTPVARLLSREPTVTGLSVLCYGSDVWSPRLQARRVLERYLMRRPQVRVVGISGFTAGALARDCNATILAPGLSRKWFDTLVSAATAVRSPGSGIQLVTAFRLDSWQEKGLPELVEAVRALGNPDIGLTICGSGEPPPDLLHLLGAHRWCTLRVGLSDRELAYQLAVADLFVLATRTRQGRRPSGEGFGLVLLESQIAGTPVIAPAYGGSRDAYVEGVTGLAPEDETTDALARLLGTTLEDPAGLAWMGKRAAEWARESFDPGRYAQLVARKLL